VTILSMGVAVLAVLAYAPAAWAHAEFEGSASVPADSDQTLTIHVPEERGRQIHNAKLIVEVPSAFTVKSCQAKPEWQCVTGTAQGGAGLVTFTRTSGTSDDPLFTYSLHTPAQAAQYPFKVSQTYSDGKVVVWDGPETSDTPSAAPAPAPTPAPAPAPTPAPAPAVAPRPAASAAPQPVTAPSAASPRPAAPARAHVHAAQGLPRTGSTRTPLVLAGAALALGGLGVAGGARRRRRRVA
jgi:LPXTG-motif cell wall-anchored protein